VVAAVPTRPSLAFKPRRDLLAVELERRFGHRLPSGWANI
jgi:hypothetical protein